MAGKGGTHHAIFVCTYDEFIYNYKNIKAMMRTKLEQRNIEKYKIKIFFRKLNYPKGIENILRTSIGALI